MDSLAFTFEMQIDLHIPPLLNFYGFRQSEISNAEISDADIVFVHISLNLYITIRCC